MPVGNADGDKKEEVRWVIKHILLEYDFVKLDNKSRLWYETMNTALQGEWWPLQVFLAYDKWSETDLLSKCFVYAK